MCMIYPAEHYFFFNTILILCPISHLGSRTIVLLATIEETSTFSIWI